MRKWVVVLGLAAAFLGCDQGSPTEPSPTAPPASQLRDNPSTAIWGVIVPEGGSGVCIVGAKAEIVAGQGAGQSMVQVTPCDWWGYGGGFWFDGLLPGVPLTVRASASGYRAEEMTVVPTYPVVLRLGFDLKRIQK